jgi:hypothetical protein
VRSGIGRSVALLVVMFVIAAGAGCTTGGGWPWWTPTTTTTVPGGGPGGGHRQVSYGPYTIPAMAGDRMGMIRNRFEFGIEKPCTNCYLTSIRAGLVAAADGTSVNVREGLWLHHMNLVNSSSTDLTCARGFGYGGERFFASGNERTPIDLSRSGNYGYPVRPADSWSILFELMNMTTAPANVRITVDFDWVPLTSPGFKAARPVWLDIGGQCGISDRPARSGRYEYTPAPWFVTTPAKLLYVHGHMHDGATDLLVLHNDRVVCDSFQHYGEKPEYVEGPSSAMPGMAHISSVDQCQGTAAAPLTRLAVGDRLSITARYDADAHMQMGDEPVMGIAHAWVDASGS